MIVKIGPYTKWYSAQRIEDKWLRWRYPESYFFIEEDEMQSIDRAVIRMCDGIQWILNNTINPLNALRGRRVKVRLHKYDTWNMDHTLALIILPMLKQLRDTSHGMPLVDPADVPRNLKPTKAQLDEYHKNMKLDPKAEARWNWVMDEMIFAFKSIADDSWEEQFYPMSDKPISDLLNDDCANTIDREGYDKYKQRIQNGLNLFVKYYFHLWD